MRKASIKREIAYKEGLLNGVNYACDKIDELICESNSHTENVKLWKLRDTMRALQTQARGQLEEEYMELKKIG
jgi:hypothetical protein